MVREGVPKGDKEDIDAEGSGDFFGVRGGAGERAGNGRGSAAKKSSMLPMCKRGARELKMERDGLSGSIGGSRAVKDWPPDFSGEKSNNSDSNCANREGVDGRSE